MPFNQRSLDDYIDVATRIAEFRAKYPDGYLAPLDPAEPFRIVNVQGWDRDESVTQQTFVVVVAAAYRQPGDTSPGVGMAWEVFPGRTPYTRGSELMNAETSAWGRAIVAVGAADSRTGIASREEVRNRQAERDQPASADMNNADRENARLMTSAQRAAHTRLARMDDPPRKAERTTGPDPDDPWTREPAQEAP